MGRINSSIGSVAQNPQQTDNMKRFVVEDPTAPQQMEQQQIEQPPVFDRRRSSNVPPNYVQAHAHEVIDVGDEEDIFEAVEQIRKKRNSLDPDKKNKIEILLGLKRKYGKIKIDNHVITLRNLSAKESKRLVKSAFDLQKEEKHIDQIYDIRNFTLAFAIYAIDDVKISDILGKNDNLEMRVSMIEEMPEDAIIELHKFYESDIASNQPKNEVEAKEVVEDIKKS